MRERGKRGRALAVALGTAEDAREVWEHLLLSYVHECVSMGLSVMWSVYECKCEQWGHWTVVEFQHCVTCNGLCPCRLCLNLDMDGPMYLQTLSQFHPTHPSSHGRYISNITRREQSPYSEQWDLTCYSIQNGLCWESSNGLWTLHMDYANTPTCTIYQSIPVYTSSQGGVRGLRGSPRKIWNSLISLFHSVKVSPMRE